MGLRAAGVRVRVQVAIAAAACAACGARPHALDYVVLPDQGGEQRPARGAPARQGEAPAPKESSPISAQPPTPSPATGGSCGVGLIGEECERGLLEDETPIDQRMLLGPDGVVIEDWDDLTLPSATPSGGDRGSAPRARRPRG